MSDHSDIVLRAYDAQAKRYADHVQLQSGNLDRLLTLLEASRGPSSRGAWLDVGCGSGILARRLAAANGELPAGLTYTGVDLSPGMIDVARGRGPVGARFVAADARALPFDDRRFDVAVSNSVLHWLNHPQAGHTPAAAFVELARVLAPDGWLAVSVAGAGTARRFQAAYRRVMEEEARRPGFDVARYRDDPIGCMALHDVVGLAERAGLPVAHAELRYEPVRYDQPSHYVDDVEAYGYGIYLAPVDAGRRAAVWDRVRAAFVAAEGAGPYNHDQYMVYLIGRANRAGYPST